MLIMQTGSFWVDEKNLIYAKVILWTENNLETAYFLENGYNDFDLLTNVFKNPMTVWKNSSFWMTEMADFLQFREISQTEIYFENRLCHFWALMVHKLYAKKS